MHLHKDIRVSFNMPIQKHTKYKMECVENHINIKDFMFDLVERGWKEYQREKLNQKLQRGIDDAKAGRMEELNWEELKKMENLLDD